MLLNAAKCQGYSFYWFWVIKEKPTTVVGNGTNWGNSQPKLEKTYPEKHFLNKSHPKQTFYTFLKNSMNQPEAISSPSLNEQKISP